METYKEFFIRIDKTDIRHTEMVIAECLDTLRSAGLQQGIEMEVDKEQGVLYISLYPDIIQKQTTNNGKQTGRPRKAISADSETIRDMIAQYGAADAAQQLGVSKKTMYRRLAE